ncbi:MAG: S41 family peptidase [Planctomycetales bacterium]|nr:S41 family peptidase [Planctomycetales bacterium]
MSFTALLRLTFIFLSIAANIGLSNPRLLLSQTESSRPAEQSDAVNEQQAITEGNDLRKSRQWAKAIELYEKSLKVWPVSEPLTQGLRQSKIQFSIDRRYSDNSFLNRMLPLSRAESMAYLDDLYEKVRRYYVENIGPTILLAHGTESLYFALNNEKYLSRNLPTIDRERVSLIRRKLRDVYWNKQITSQDHARRTVVELCDLLQRELSLPAGPVVMEFVFGACNSLDDYSSYLTPGKLDDLYSNIDGEFVGIGIEMKAESGSGLLLVNVLPESPAEEGGVVAGDLIVEIDGTDARKISTEDAAQLLQGKQGSHLRLTLADGETGKERFANLTRRAVKIKSIPVARIIDHANGIAYLQMTGFQKNTIEELDTALVRLNREGMRALIWDVRGNPGGLLNAAVEALDRFIDDGVLVSTKGRTSDQNSTYAAQSKGTWKVAIVLLTDGDSASASEIVAGAIHDHRRGTIVGRKTYGKWSVQTILPGHAESGFRLTTAKFYSPHGETYGKIGIKPDIVVAEDTSKLGLRGVRRTDSLEDDRDVEAGLEVLRKQMARR